MFNPTQVFTYNVYNNNSYYYRHILYNIRRGIHSRVYIDGGKVVHLLKSSSRCQEKTFGINFVEEDDGAPRVQLIVKYQNLYCIAVRNLLSGELFVLDDQGMVTDRKNGICVLNFDSSYRQLKKAAGRADPKTFTVGFYKIEEAYRNIRELRMSNIKNEEFTVLGRAFYTFVLSFSEVLRFLEADEFMCDNFDKGVAFPELVYRHFTCWDSYSTEFLKEKNADEDCVTEYKLLSVKDS